MSAPQQDFVHLHVHSEFSLLDGLSKIKDLIARAQELGQPAVALTDHGSMHGTIDFYNAATDAGVKPIVGVEAYMTQWGRPMSGRDSQLDRARHHLLLLAENQTGYSNLLKIVSAAELQGYYYRPRVDADFLAQHSEGIICTTGCMAAEVPYYLNDENRAPDPKLALERLHWYLDVFGKDRFYIELQEHSIPTLHGINKTLLEWSGKYGMGMVATNDVHYVRAEDATPHDILLCVQTSSSFNAEKRMRMSDSDYYLKSRAEMEDLFLPFADLPASVFTNTLKIAEMCTVDLSPTGYHLPSFDVPSGLTAESYLRQLVEKGLDERYGSRAREPETQARKEHELKIIHQMGFDTYFLIVWDLCEYARQRNIWWNVRGSGAGSLVAYVVGITQLDPLPNNLIFERFLNPGRVSMPDFDLDYPDDQRDQMIEYTIQKYGEDQVAQIVVFGTMKARGSVRDVARVMEVPLDEVDSITKLIPGGPKVTIKKGLEEVTELRMLYDRDKRTRELIETAQKLEGVARHVSIHPAAVIVADKPLVHYTPLRRSPSKGLRDYITQYTYPVLESLGLLKLDFLGLSTLTIMRVASELIQKRRGKNFTLENIPTDDPRSYELLASGEVTGVFQVESEGMRRVLRSMQPTKFEQIVATISLYRPGPMQYIPDYVERMHGKQKVTYADQALEPILSETYGIIVYQEQIIQIASQLAGYTPGEADLMRRAVAKKKEKEMAEHQVKFIEGAVERGIAREAANKIYEDIVFFANYGFNKCLPGDVEVVDIATGRLLRVADLYQQRAHLDHTLTCDLADRRLGKGSVSKVMENGIKPVFRLSTALGRSIEATGNHPFYTIGGWSELDDLQVGDLIAVSRRLPVEGCAQWLDHEVVALAQELDTCGKNKREFVIPATVFELNNRQIALLISRMWAGTGRIQVAERDFSYATVSERMARQLQHLLLRLNIVSRLQAVEHTYKGGGTDFQLVITGDESIAAFAEKIHVYFLDPDLKSGVQNLYVERPVSPITQNINPVVIKEFAGDTLSRSGLSGEEIRSETDDAYREIYPQHAAANSSSHRTSDIDRKTCCDYSDNDLYWDEIVDIEYAGEKQTYDLEVPGTNNFIANDILVHNSHAADYAVITVQTAYLKAHYPVEYMAALLTVELDNQEKVTNFITECRKMGIAVLPPDINQSDLGFAIREELVEVDIATFGRSTFDFQAPKGSAIRFGLGAVKNVGHGPVEEILRARVEGTFASLQEFCERADLRKVNKRALECLIKVGAFDAYGDRETVLAIIDRMMQLSINTWEARDVGQISLFDMFDMPEQKSSAQDLFDPPPVYDQVPARERLGWEKELLGVYVSEHPLERVTANYKDVISCLCSEVAEDKAGREVVLAGMIAGIRNIFTKKGKRMAFVTLEDLQGNCDVTIFSRTLEATPDDLLQVGNVVLVRGKIESHNERVSVLADHISDTFSRAVAADDILPQFASPPPPPSWVPEESPPEEYPQQPADEEDLPWSSTLSKGGENGSPKHLRPDGDSPTGHTGSNDSTEQPHEPPSLHTLRLKFSLSTSGKEDNRRLVETVQLFRQYEGQDRFLLVVNDSRGTVELDFPNDTTRCCDELLDRLQAMHGTGCLEVS